VNDLPQLFKLVFLAPSLWSLGPIGGQLDLTLALLLEDQLGLGIGSHISKTIINETTNQCFITLMDFGIRLLNEWYPEFTIRPTSSKDQVFISIVFLIAGKSVINNDISPSLVLEESEDIHSILSEIVEHWWIDTRSHSLGFFVVNLTIFVL